MLGGVIVPCEALSVCGAFEAVTVRGLLLIAQGALLSQERRGPVLYGVHVS